MTSSKRSGGAPIIARRKTGVAHFGFYDYRHTAKIEWSRQRVHVNVAMKAAGHNRVAMHQLK